MSSVQSGNKAASVCPVRLFYGLTEQRLSRNAAAAGMLGVMAMTFFCALAMQAEKTLSLPAVRQERITLMHAEFRTVPEVKKAPPETNRLLAEASDFEIPEEVRPEVKPEPSLEKKAEPEVKPKPEPRPEVRKMETPKRVPKKKPKDVPKRKAVTPAEKVQPGPGTAVSGKSAEISGSSGASAMPGAAGSVEAKADGRSAALAAILQAVEKHKQYPRQGRRSGAEGTCALRVHVSADGRVDACTLAEGSGRAVLDAAAKRLGERLIGLDVGVKGGFNVIVPVHYRLSDG